MIYADFSLKKTVAIIAVGLVIIAATGVTSAAWTKLAGDFSIRTISFTFESKFSTWLYRLEFNWQHPQAGRSAGEKFLAALGAIIPPIPAEAGAASTEAQVAAAIPVLIYHGILPSSQDNLNVTASEFKDQMFRLKADGWQTVTIYDFVEAMQGKIKLPPKSFLLTFDDGRKDSYYPVEPILEALGYHAVMYVIAGRSLAPNNDKSSYYLSQTELLQMAASGHWDLQSHSQLGHTHYPIDAAGTLGDFFEDRLWIPTQNPGESDAGYEARIYNDLTQYYLHNTPWPLVPGREETLKEYENRIANDLTNAKQDIESKLGVRVVSFAYPFNTFLQSLQTDVQNGKSALTNEVDSIYPVSFYQWSTQQGYSENYPGNDGQLLKRIEPRPDWSTDLLMNLITTGQPKPLPFKNSPNFNDGWRQVGLGSVVEENNALSLRAVPETTGAFTLLDGARLWKDYLMTIDFDWLSGESFSLIGRYDYEPETQNTNYVECNFSNGSVRFDAISEKITSVLAEKTDPDISTGSGKNAAMRITGGTAECLWNGAAVLSAPLPGNAPQKGGPAIAIWDRALGTAKAIIHSVSVTQQ